MTYIVDGLVRNLATGIASEAVYDVTVLLIEVGEVGVVHHIHSGIEAHTKINAVVVDYDVGSWILRQHDAILDGLRKVHARLTCNLLNRRVDCNVQIIKFRIHFLKVGSYPVLVDFSLYV